MASNFPDLLYLIGQGHQGGVKALAVRMEKNPTVFQHKFNPNNTTHFLNPVEIEAVVDLRDANGRVAEFFAGKADKLVIDKVVVDGSDMNLLEGFLEVMKEMGDFAAAFQLAYADHVITDDELQTITSEGEDVMAKMAGLIDRIRQVVKC
ncbi:phage regulatory CII family protein [Methylobacillus sp. Pita2]|uniref:phage regulatory CII family protein n=1 Tax=Methylobacillus sp. Pita2 TaxID=3383245 RepID=UPI0038B49F8A